MKIFIFVSYKYNVIIELSKYSYNICWHLYSYIKYIIAIIVNVYAIILIHIYICVCVCVCARTSACVCTRVNARVSTLFSFTEFVNNKYFFRRLLPPLLRPTHNAAAKLPVQSHTYTSRS